MVSGSRFIIEDDVNKIDYKVRTVFTTVIILLAVILLIMFFIWHVLYDKNRYYKSVAEMESALRENEEKYLKSLSESNESLSEFRHNVDFMLETLCACSKKKNYDELDNMLFQMDERFRSIEIFDTGNVILDSLLNRYSKESADKNIGFEARGHIYGSIDIPAIDFSSVVGNILKNAFEECCRLREGAWIKSDIKMIGDCCLITIKNSSVAEEYKNEVLISSKKDTLPHGIGINSIIKASDKYPGMAYEWKCSEHVFETSIMFPVKTVDS